MNTGFEETKILKLVELIAKHTGLLLEVVNYNIPSQQYVCAGHVSLSGLVPNSLTK